MSLLAYTTEDELVTGSDCLSLPKVSLEIEDRISSMGFIVPSEQIFYHARIFQRRADLI